MKQIFILLCSLLIAALCGATNGYASSEGLVEWTAVFTADGTVGDLRG